MYTNVNLAAPVGVVLLFGAGLLVFMLTLVFFYVLLTKRIILIGSALLAFLVFVFGYHTTLFVFSILSKTQVLTHGEEKHFCEVDCHLAYSIVDVTRMKTIGVAPEHITAAGTFYVIRVRTRFDGTTISPTRGDGELYPNPRKLVIVDANGREYLPSAQATETFARNGLRSTEISTPLRPSESYTTTFVFDLPTNSSHPTLRIQQDEWITRLIIGHENSPAHKQIYFQI